jgi:putative FmdB family regulatory protein
MPTYDYFCQDCNHRFERFEKMSDDGLKECPKCKKKKSKRLLGPGCGALFKGPGFYHNDKNS